MNALQKIKNDGFEVELSNGNLVIQPFSKLTPQQIDFLKSHKAEIIKELEAANDFSELEDFEDFEDFEDIVIVKTCNECDFFQPDEKYNPSQGMGRCELGINRRNKPLYPMQDACDQAKPLTPF